MGDAVVIPETTSGPMPASASSGPAATTGGYALPPGVNSMEEWGRTLIRPQTGGRRVIPPEGVNSLEEWGRTICKLPKMAKKQLSYRELANEGHVNQETYNYLTKFVMCHNGPSGKVSDFKQYLEAIDFENESPLTYAPSKMSGRTLKG